MNHSIPSYTTASACLGMCCPIRARCVRYERVQIWGSQDADATCVTKPLPTWPGFLAPRQDEAVPA